MKKITNEFKVGLFFILSLAALFYLSASTGKLDFKKSGYYLYVLFDEVAGLQKKAPVMLNGLEVGKVDEIKLIYDNQKTQVRLKLWLDKEAKISANPVVSIKTLGLMGEKFIQIASFANKGYLPADTLLEGKPYMDLDVLMEQSQGITKSLDSLIANINNLTTEVKGLATENKDKVSLIISNLEVTSKNFEEFSSDIKAHPWKLLFKGKEKKTN